MTELLKKRLKELNCPLKINHVHLKNATSTNTLLKEMAASGEHEGTLLTADTQSAGRGRLDRSFHSPESGLYMSLLLRPYEQGIRLHAENSLNITTAAAVSVCRAIESVCGRSCGIKWVNDIYSEGKKLCGILTEGSLVQNSYDLDYAILGIGVNIEEPKNGFPPEIAGIAGAIYKYGEKSPEDILETRAYLAAEIINNFSKVYTESICGKTPTDEAFINEYRSRSVLNGKRIEIIRGNDSVGGRAIEINPDCSLTVETDDGEILSLTYGEVRIKIGTNN